MQYYGAADSVSGLSDASLERRSRLLHAMGEDDLQSARFSEAFGKFAGAHRTTGQILANNPDKPDAIFAHSQSEYWLGYAAFRTNRPKSTIKHFEQYKRLADRLVELEPGKPEWHREAGYANGNLCSHYLTEPKNPDSAVSFCKKALRNVQDYMTSSKAGLSAKVDLANRYAWLADALFASGQVEQAWDNRERQRELLEQLRAAEPKNADFVLHQVQYFIAIAKFPQARANRVQSRFNYTKAKAELDRLVARDPQNKDTSSYIGKLQTAYAFLD
jgi:tetratricopeptide (TPR) repeat protein